MASFPQASPPTRLSSPICATCPAHLIRLDFTTRTILGKEYRSFSKMYPLLVSVLCQNDPVHTPLFCFVIISILYMIHPHWCNFQIYNEVFSHTQVRVLRIWQPVSTSSIGYLQAVVQGHKCIYVQGGNLAISWQLVSICNSLKMTHTLGRNCLPDNANL